MKGNFFSVIVIALSTLTLGSSKTILTGTPEVTEDPRKFIEELSQATWYKSYDAECDCHTIGVKYYKKEETLDTTFIDSYLVLVNREFNKLYSEETVTLFEDNRFNSKFRYYIPDYNGQHRKKKSYVIWDIENFPKTCHVEFKIKYFDCDEAAKIYYDNKAGISDRKYIIFRTAVEESNLPYGDYQDVVEIKRILTNLMECEQIPEGKCEDCCMPYPCLVNAESINCVCALMPESPECDCAINDNCSTKYENEIVAE